MPTINSTLQRGFSLIELSVATAIYSMGLGSLSLLMLLAVQGTNDAGFATVASLHTASLAEQILVNPGSTDHFLAPPGVVSAPDCGFGEACGAEDMAAWQIGTWRGRLARDLPAGTGLVCRDSTPDDGHVDDPGCDGSGVYTIKVFWRAAGDPTRFPDEMNRHVIPLPTP